MILKNICDRCGESKPCHGYAGKYLLCDNCARLMSNDLIPDHYDKEEDCDVMVINLEAAEIQKDWQRWHKKL